MSIDRTELTNPRKRLPDPRLFTVPGGELRPVRAPGRRAPVLVLLHGPKCAACRAWADALASASSALEEWDGAVRLVLPASADVASRFAETCTAPFPVVADPEQRVARGAGVRPPAVVIADPWGEIHLAASAGPGHGWPTTEEIVEWLRFLAIQCPECEGEAL